VSSARFSISSTPTPAHLLGIQHLGQLVLGAKDLLEQLLLREDDGRHLGGGFQVVQLLCLSGRAVSCVVVNAMGGDLGEIISNGHGKGAVGRELLRIIGGDATEGDAIQAGRARFCGLDKQLFGIEHNDGHPRNHVPRSARLRGIWVGGLLEPVVRQARSAEPRSVRVVENDVW
jgi:hypothetical protein